MSWSIRLPSRSEGVLRLPRRPRHPSAERRTVAPPLAVVRRYGDRTVLEVHHRIGPASEPRLGRLLHATVRPGLTELVIDLRRVAPVGAGTHGVLELAQVLAARHSLSLRIVTAGEKTDAPGGGHRPEGLGTPSPVDGFGDGGRW
ncbi:hypothetical protein ACFYVL_08065 [Streptomyces sp. NPDC004111]|uniref:hypothetical protein n=1 Tax=Streptomyces sp. NPDC004111 TaxID=3364690 RepID=UPI00369BD8AD